MLTKARPSWPHVGLLTSLGGGGERDDAVLARAFEAGEAALDALATDAARLVRSRGLDGLNVHWAVPDLEGDVDSQALGLVTFLKVECPITHLYFLAPAVCCLFDRLT